MNYYNEIKDLLINNEINKKIKDYSKNQNDLKTYYDVGKLLVEAQGGEKRAKYGNKLIKEYSKKLTSELGKGYSKSSLEYMRRFYIFQKTQTVFGQLSWSHYIEILKFNDKHKICYYINKNIKTKDENETIGIIICKNDDKFIIKYSSDERIISREYILM